MEPKVGIVVLNYLNYIDTIECIDSIAILDYKNIEIVVVENGSSNESFEKIYNHCKGKRNVRVIKVKRNLGFARGCNVGIDYALRRKCEHVLVVNNDTIFIDKDMIVKLLKVAEDQKIGLIGPGIIGADPKDQRTMFTENPCNTETTFRRIFKDLKIEIFGPRFIYTLLMRPWLKKFLKRFIKINKNKLIERDDGGHTESSETIISNNLVLNGSAILFTKNYFKHFTCGFYPGTFLYYEENILNVIARKKGIWMACVPQAKIYHKGARSALSSYGNNPKWRRLYRARSILTCLYVKIMPLILLGIERRPDLPPKKWTQRRVGNNIDASSLIRSHFVHKNCMGRSLDFSRWAVVGHKDESAFAKQAEDIRSVLNVKYLLAVPSEKLTDKKLEENDILLDPNLSREKLEKVVRDLEGVIFFERHNWHKDLLDTARELNIKTICLPNWEWFNGKDEKWKLVDWFACPNVHTLNIVKSFGFVNATHLAYPLDIARLPKREVNGPAKQFVYNGGIVNEDDRKSLKETLRAFRMVKDPGISLAVRFQKDIRDYKPLPLLKRVYYKYFLKWALDQRWKAAKELKRSIARDNRITLEVRSLEDPADLYKEGDVIIYASKLEGTCLGVMEAIACGMPVITTNAPPMNEYVKQKEMLVKTKRLKRKALPNMFGFKTAYLKIPKTKDLAKKIKWCAENDLSEVSKQNRELAERTFSRDNIKREWSKAIAGLK